MQALRDDDMEKIRHCSELLYSSRETRELRAEERQRGLALKTLLKQLDIEHSCFLDEELKMNQLLGLCIAAQHWNIEPLA